MVLHLVIEELQDTRYGANMVSVSLPSLLKVTEPVF